MHRHKGEVSFTQKRGGKTMNTEYQQIPYEYEIDAQDERIRPGFGGFGHGFGFGRPGFGFGRPFGFGFGLPFLGGLAAGALLGGAYGGYGYGGYGYPYYDPYYSYGYPYIY